MDIITQSVIIRGATDVTGAVISALCRDNPTDAEKWQAIRTVRSELLAQTDYTMLPDAPPYTQEQIDAIANYRQILRDIPQTYINAEDVIFPEMPQI